ncbi:MAG: hypothetical protein J5636_05840 [Clostridiales bacterium]|nr:hypothetical protein [Clostridiales bacterium]
MNQDGIRLAEMLASKYGTFHSIGKEIENREFAINKARAAASAPKMNRPETKGVYVILALVATVSLYIVGGLVYLMVWSMAYTYANKILPFIMLLPLIVAAIILAVGAERGHKEMKAHNAAAEREEEGRQKKIGDLQQELDDLRSQAQLLQSELDEYVDRVPENMRTRNRMMQVKTHLETGDVSTFEEAVTLVSGSNK